MAFSAKTLDFLFENRLQDSRDWFLEHKDTYQAVLLEPMKDLVRSLTPVMLEIDAKVTTEPRVDKTICRLRRDTRYSHDKSLYRDTMWLIFKRGKMHGTEVPGIYFEITCDGFNYGCGFYHASAAYMNTMRRLILQGDPAFEKAKKAFLSFTLVLYLNYPPVGVSSEDEGELLTGLLEVSLEDGGAVLDGWLLLGAVLELAGGVVLEVFAGLSPPPF